MEAKGVVVLIVVGLLFAGVGWKLGIQATNEAIENADVTVEGQIVSTEIDRVSADDDDSSMWSYEPTVTYQYTYEGQTYTNTNIKPGPGKVSNEYESRAKAQDYLEKYPAGETVTVYLNPDDPTRSFLEKERPGLGMYAFTGVGVLMALAGVLGGLKSLFDVASSAGDLG